MSTMETRRFLESAYNEVSRVVRQDFSSGAYQAFTYDDINRGDGLNLYAYCANNPVVYNDFIGYARRNNTNLRNYRFWGELRVNRINRMRRRPVMLLIEVENLEFSTKSI